MMSTYLFSINTQQFSEATFFLFQVWSNTDLPREKHNVNWLFIEQKKCLLRYDRSRNCVHEYYNLFSATKEKIEDSVTEASPSDSDSSRLAKQESAWSIHIGEIFQLEIWNSGNFVFIFLFTLKLMRKGT